MRLAVVVLAALFFATSGLSATAPKPKPWAWTAAQAAQHVGGSCRGVGKAVSKHWVAFSCSSDDGRVWVKVRPRGKGGACVSGKSLRAVSAVCMSARGLVPLGQPTRERQTPEGEVGKAMTARFNPSSTIPWQGLSGWLECVGADGFYECALKGDIAGTVYVMYRPETATVKFVSLTCTGTYEGRPECAT